MSILYYVASALFLLYIVLDITWRIWKRKLSFLPSRPNVPWLGVVPYLTTCPHEMYKERVFNSIKYNHLYVVWVLHRPIIVTGNVEYIEPLLKSRENITKARIYEMLLQEWLGEGLLTSTGAKWKKRRISLTGAFHFTILNDFMEIYEKHAINLVKKLKDLASKSREVEVQWIFSLAMLDVICETSMGASINALNSSDSEYVRSIHRMKILLLKRISSPFSGSKIIYPYTQDGKEYYKCLNTVHSFTRKVIDENIAFRQHSPTKEKLNEHELHESYGRKNKVFIDILLDLYEKGEIDIEGIREEVDTFMFEGHDTTSSALSWTIYEIGRHPDVQEKLHDEIDNASSNDCSLMDKIRSLKFMECVIKESLRLHPPVPGYSRKLVKDIVINNNVIPAGTFMGVDTFSVHMNPAYWDEPTAFNPSRFQSEDFAKRNPYCYVPFSAGPRNCIGQKFAMLEEKVFIYLILSNFHVKSIQTPDEIRTGVQLITESMNGINIEFHVRNCSL